jgi:hypothetical protein
MGQAKDHWPLKPGFQVMRLFTHTCKPGWRAMKIEGGKATVSVAAVRGEGGHFTAYALNQSSQPITVSIGGIPRGTPLRCIVWNGDKEGTGRLERGEAVKIDRDGQVKLELKARSLVALTSEPFEP